MCFGGNDSRPGGADIPPPPPPPEILDFFDELTGTQSIVVTGPDGKKRMVKSRMPRTPEEEAEIKGAKELVASTIKNITQLYKYDPHSVIDFAPLIETFANLNRERMESLGQIANIGNIEQDIADFKAMQRTIVDEEYRIASVNNETNLASRGLGSSTYGKEARNLMDKSRIEAIRKADIEGTMYGEDLAATRLNRNTQAYSLQEMGRQARTQEAQAKYALAKDQETDLEKRRRFAIEENQNLMNIGQGILNADLNKALSNKNTPEQIALFNSQASDSIARYNADVNRQQINYNMAMDQYDNQPSSFLEKALNIGGSIAGKVFTSADNTMAGRLGKKYIG